MTNELIRSVLTNAFENGKKTHYIAQCPWCSRDEHLYVQKRTTRTSGGRNVSFMFQCKRCGEAGGYKRLLRKLDKMHIIEDGQEVDIFNFTKKTLKIIDEIVPEKDQIPPPIGFVQVEYHPYLAKRGFTDQHYEHYKIGISNIDFSMQDRIIFLVQENELTYGYLSRSTKDREWIDRQNAKAKEDGTYKYLRYKNSTSDFAKLLMGIDEITENTNTVILVEGIFDKSNVDLYLNLFDNEQTKCCACFGKKVTSDQIAKLRAKGISNVILMFDPDAIAESKSTGSTLQKVFDSVKVAFLNEKDPGDLTKSEFLHIFSNLESPFMFSLNKLQIKKL